jgi:hypothetical protein
MKIIITENQYRLLRRQSEIKDRIDDILDSLADQNNLRGVGLTNLLLIVSDSVGRDIADKTNLKDDDYITFRNQMIQYIRTNFYEYIKEFLESKQ